MRLFRSFVRHRGLGYRVVAPEQLLQKDSSSDPSAIDVNAPGGGEA